MTTTNTPTILDLGLDDLIAEGAAILAAKKLKFGGPRSTNANLKRRAPTAQSILGDLIPAAPVNPAYKWTATRIEFHVATVKCACGHFFHVPNEPLCRWERPHQNQAVSNRRFPADWQSLPKRVISADAPTLVTGCMVCLTLTPAEISTGPLTEAPLPSKMARVDLPCTSPLVTRYPLAVSDEPDDYPDDTADLLDLDL